MAGFEHLLGGRLLATGCMNLALLKVRVEHSLVGREGAIKISQGFFGAAGLLAFQPRSIKQKCILRGLGEHDFDLGEAV